MYVPIRTLKASAIMSLTISLMGIACNSASPGDGTGGDVTGEADGPPADDEADGPDDGEADGPPGDESGETTGPPFEPDENACAALLCETVEDCCSQLGVQASPNLPADTALCPGVYPNNWSCPDVGDNAGNCVNAGCSADSDCGHPSLSCKVISSVGYCVQVCDPMDDAPCGPEAMYLACSGEADDETYFCQQSPPPPS